MNWNQCYADHQTPWDSGQPSAELLRILEERQIRPCRALEIGCGTGTNAVFLAQRGFDMTAFDLAPLAIEQARARAKSAKVNIKLLEADALRPPEALGTFDFVFDRGVYHVLRKVDLAAFLRTLERVTAAGGLYLTLAGNANDPSPPEQGPPRVHAHELCQELSPLFDVVQLREFHFDGVAIDGKPIRPLAWSALSRRKG